MTLTPQAEARIEQHLGRLAPRRGGQAARQELRSHLMDAAEAEAADGPATPLHVDAAVAALGSDEEIRAAFFPTRRRPGVPAAAIALLALAAALAVAGILADGGGGATCAVEGAGTCEASSSGAALDVIVWGAPPLLVLAALAFAPAWLAAGLAGVYLVVAFLRGLATGFGWDALLVASALLCLGACAWVVLRRRKGAVPDA